MIKRYRVSASLFSCVKSYLDVMMKLFWTLLKVMYDFVTCLTRDVHLEATITNEGGYKSMFCGLLGLKWIISFLEIRFINSLQHL